MAASPRKAKRKLASEKSSSLSSRVAKLYESALFGHSPPPRMRIRRPVRIHTHQPTPQARADELNKAPNPPRVSADDIMPAGTGRAIDLTLPPENPHSDPHHWISPDNGWEYHYEINQWDEREPISRYRDGVEQEPIMIYRDEAGRIQGIDWPDPPLVHATAEDLSARYNEGDPITEWPSGGSVTGRLNSNTANVSNVPKGNGTITWSEIHWPDTARRFRAAKLGWRNFCRSSHPLIEVLAVALALTSLVIGFMAVR